MLHKTTKSSPQALKADGYTLRGKGVVFGGRDLQHESFTKNTDFGSTRSFVGMPVYYDHALGGIVTQVGTVKQWQLQDDGIDVEIELDRRHKYAKQIMELVKRGALGLSTGALSHLVERDGAEIKRWIIGEISLTPTPAEPRTYTNAEVLEAGAQAGDSAPVKASADTVDTHTLGDTPTMDREELKAALVEIAGEPVQGGGVVVAAPQQAPAAKKLTGRGFSSENIEALVHYIKTGDEIPARQTLKAAMNEGTGANGGYLVPEDYATQITDKRDETWIGAKLPVQRYTTSRDIFNIADQDEKSDFAFVAEAGAANFDEPTFTNSGITIYTASLAMKLSNQLLRDQAMDLEGFLSREIGRAYARHLNQYMITGSGSSQPYGILARATTSETLASVSGVDQADIINIVHKLPEWYADDSRSVGWVMRNATLGAIRALQGNFFSFQPTPSGDLNSLYGKPIAVTDKIAALGTGNKPIIFGNFLYYAFVENLGLEIVRNPYSYMPNYQTGIFVTVRWGGDVTQPDAFVYGVNP